MIRMIQSASASHAKRYFNDALSKTDYYLNDQEIRGELKGRIAMRMCLSGSVTKDIFHMFCENLNPVTGLNLTPRKKHNRTIGYDINFHVPKSVSILHALTEDTKILTVFRSSVQAIMEEIEQDSQTRVRKQGKDENRQTGELVWGEFIHQTARPVDGSLPDPHLHSHCFVFNVTFDNVENRYKAGQFQDIKRDMPYYQAKFHKVLSDGLIGLGYHIRRTSKSFEITGVPQDVIALFSKRTDEIGRIAKELNITDAETLDQLGSRTRANKQKSLTMSQLKQAWRSQIKEAVLNESSETLIHAEPESFDQTIQNCIDHALTLRFERASVMQDRRILETAYRFGLGNGSVSAEHITQALKDTPEIIAIQEGSKTFCTTKELLKEEQFMIALAKKGQGALLPLYLIAPEIALEGDQLEAVKHILTTTDRVSIIQGRAGTGKTTLMQEAVKLINHTGRLVTVVAPTAEASRGVLRQEGFQDAETVAKLLSNVPLQKKLLNGVLWVDEAGLLGNKDMTALLTLADHYNARLILSGDTRQHPSVIRGDALRIINTQSNIVPAEVNRIYRQRDEVYRKAVQLISTGNLVEAFEQLNAIGALKQMNADNPYQGLVKDYFAALQNKKTVLAICPTHAQGDVVTAEIRKELKHLGKIDHAEKVISRLIPMTMTEAEKSDWRNYQVGQIIQFNQNGTGIIKGSHWAVSEVSKSNITLQDDKGKTSLLPLDKPKSFELYQQSTIALAKGDMVRITHNGLDTQNNRLNNGQVLTVIDTNSKDKIALKSPTSKAVFTIDFDYGHLAHAYCLTSHASQGKTVDEIFIAQPAASFPATNMKQFYVSASRARDKVHIYSDDIPALLENVLRSGDRLSAMELVKRDEHLQQDAEHLIRSAIPSHTTKMQPVINIHGPSTLKGIMNGSEPVL